MHVHATHRGQTRIDRLGVALAAGLSAQLPALPLRVQRRLRAARLHALAARPAGRPQVSASTGTDST